MDRLTSARTAALGHQDGFSLVEVLISIIVLTIGLMSLAGVLALGVQRVAASSPSLIAREKAREAVESVHTARDTGLITWQAINNTGSGGRFVSGDQPIRLPGPDGLVNTTDDLPDIETQRKPGYDGILGTTDDALIPLNEFTRNIAITPLMSDDGQAVNQNLREITVTVR
ncbi:MAG TPA: prepilin-type N-terminal cleavage/methylation domain-containing protein, partial [Gemmatimonadaceae bacterium]|nr:prepilin-type N-terminal cleavage/methylation domain-containing protein [Gemmatimonadaceae bacterium]